MRRPGPVLRDGGVEFGVVSRHARSVQVCLFDDAGREAERVRLDRGEGDLHAGFISGVGAGTRYGFRIDGPWQPEAGHLFDAARLCLDPYATRIDAPFRHDRRLASRGDARGVDSAALVPKAIVEALTPAAPRPPAPAAALRRPGLIYEVNVRGFSRLNPEIPAELRGTVAALGHPAAIAHLTWLGVEAVQLMPLACFIDERHLPPLGLSNAWGYNPVAFMAPDPRLAPGGMAEIAAATAALHAAGIDVILDVVFNHTGESDLDGTTLSLRGIDNALYFRIGPDGVPVNDTGCGNTLALDRPATVALVMDALRHWVVFGGIDGFRFDLAPVLGRRADGFDPEAPLLQAMAQDPLLRDRVLIAEPWDVGPGGYRLGGFPAPFLEWNDRYRDDVRRFWRGDGGMVGALATRLAGSSDLFGNGRRPSASVNFVAAHDGMSLADIVAYVGKHNLGNGEDNRDGTSENHSWNHGVEGPTDDPVITVRREEDIRALLATLFLSRGTPMLTAGDEFGRSQSGNNNAYAQDNELTWLDWSGRDRKLEAFVGQLADLRRRLPLLAMDQWLAGAGDPPDVVWRTPSGPMSEDDWRNGGSSFLAMDLQAASPDGPAPGRVLSVFNAGGPVRMNLPDLPGAVWHVEMSTAGAPEPDAGMLDVPGRCVVVLVPEFTRRTNGMDDDELERLASAHGIATDWWDIDGGHHRVPADSLRALLAALGRPAETRGEADDAWARVRASRDRLVPATSVAREGEVSLALTLPERRHPARIDLELLLENGDRRAISVDPRDLPARVEGARIRLALPLGDLPVGYHQVLGDKGKIGHLLVRPAAGFVPERLRDGGRGFGLTSHLYGLRRHGDTGLGDLETLARFGAATAELGGMVAGINPLHHLFPQDRGRASPYQPSDRRFVDPIYLDVETVVSSLAGEAGRRAAAEILPGLRALAGAATVDYAAVWALKDRLLRAVHADWLTRGTSRAAFEAFVAAGGQALGAHALFEAMSYRSHGVDRTAWDSGAARGDRAALDLVRAREADEIGYRLFLQWQAEAQLGEAARRASEAGLAGGFLRDLAVGTAFDGGEIWAEPERFAAGVSIGAPPDPFSAEGQVWNLPPMNPLHLARTGLAAWREIVAANMRHAGGLRIDHILGFARLFFVPEGGRGADGAYVRMPRDAMIAVTAIESLRARCLVVGEDLGTAEPGLSPELRQAGIFSTRVLWFERDGAGFADPAHHPHAAVACLSTHDLPTLAGWRAGRDIAIDRQIGRIDATAEAERLVARDTERRLLAEAAGGEDALSAHRFLARSGAGLVLAQVEDLAGEVEPLNVPGTDREWPNWRRRIAPPVEDLPGSAEAAAICAVIGAEGRGGG